MSDPLMRATTAPEILAALAIACWKQAKRKGRCPESQIPDYAALAAWTGYGAGDKAIESAMHEYNRRWDVCIAAMGLEAWGEFKAHSLECAADIRARYGVPEGYQGPLTGKLADYGAESGEYWLVVGPHRGWLAAVEAKPEAGIKHPVAPYVEAWQGRAIHPANREVVTVEVPGRYGDMPLRMVRSPAALDLNINAPIEAVEIEALEVDGEPFAGRWPTVRTYYRRRVPMHAQGEREQLALPGMPGPQTLAGEPVADAILATAAEYPLTRDERSPLRGDLVQIARLGFSLTGAVRVTDSQGAEWLGGIDSVANRARWNVGTEVARALSWTINPKTREWVDLTIITRISPETISIGAPGWWHGREQAWRLTAGLWRPVILGERPRRGPGANTTNALSRTLDGIEAALSWTGRTRGKGGRIAVGLRAARRGGPGEPVRMTWREVLTYSGEYVPEGAVPMGTEGRRYRRRVKALKAAGYFCGDRGQAAPAGDSIEIVRAEENTRSREPGLWVRATARYCEAVAKSQRRSGWTHVPAAWALSRNSRQTGRNCVQLRE